ncbi:cytochrome p450 [Holotrichia oblita]|uniref:Cytochrome p450 n=1 Tax=Holotrichia oblita TaxID=644536 RepID=A0ACB9SQQ6_HOLOL|nr:cytochrome p450 [Holotrichia oblita]
MPNPLNPKRANFEILCEQYVALKKAGHKLGGIFLGTRPGYLLVDPDMIRNVLSKDFVHFQDRGTYYDEKHDPLSAHLFSLEGQKWRNLRVKLTPTFTSGKMKMMFQTLLDCGDQMMEKIAELTDQNEAIDSKDILARFTTDVIGSCAFGLECNSFKREDSEFRAHGKQLFKPNLSRKLRILMIAFMPGLSKKIGVPIFERSLTDFYLDVVKGVVKYREDNSIMRNDFMQILLELGNGKNGDDEIGGLTIEEMAAQAFVFFLAGFETSSTLMNFCLYELTQNEDIQEKTRKDILDTLKKHGGKITYDSVMEMKYLGQVIDETLRKYPPAPTLLRKCIKDYKVPNSNIMIEKGLRFGLMQSRVGLALILKDFKVKLNPKTVLPLGQNPSAFLLQPKNDVFLDMDKL